MNRRAFLTAAAALPSAAAREFNPAPALCAIAAGRGIRFGSTMEVDLDRVVPEYRELLARQIALLAPILSWGAVTRPDGAYDFTPRQATLDFAREHKIQLTGAHLLWHLSSSKVFDAEPDTARAAQMARDHITYMCHRFAGQVWSWNVVNEALNPHEGRPFGLRKSPLVEKLGTDFFDLAFETARAADPTAVLVYNDYDTELDTPHHEQRRRALLDLLDRLQQRKLPVDAIGLQTHLRIDNFRFNESLYRRFLGEIAARGVKILITELDVFDGGAPSGAAARDQWVADVYSRILTPTLDEKAVTAIVTWGLSDRYTWLTPRTGPRYARADGLSSRPLPFDERFEAKPAYHAIARALAAAPVR